MRTEIEQKRREIELIQIDHDLRLESAKRSLQNREEELVRLDRVSQPRPYTDALRQDAVVRRRDDKLVRDQTNGDTPTGGKPRTQPKARRKKS